MLLSLYHSPFAQMTAPGSVQFLSGKDLKKGHKGGIRDWCKPRKLHFCIQRSAWRLSYKCTLLSPRATLVAGFMSPHLSENGFFLLQNSKDIPALSPRIQHAASHISTI